MYEMNISNKMSNKLSNDLDRCLEPPVLHIDVVKPIYDGDNYELCHSESVVKWKYTYKDMAQAFRLLNERLTYASIIERIKLDYGPLMPIFDRYRVDVYVANKLSHSDYYDILTCFLIADKWVCELDYEHDYDSIYITGTKSMEGIVPEVNGYVELFYDEDGKLCEV